ncbi:unnamed protein product [Lactuca saligna]|uniref:Uncharacterized protein n=1 Tax=Lactuca saligna TaxID=75948 RepID=A0AA36ENH4_LACSI|nr:unnamed protein product [Lactuca saligna]
MDRYGRVPTAEEFQFLQDRFHLLPEHGVMIPKKGVSIYDHPPGKVAVPIPLFEQRQWLWVEQNPMGHGYHWKLDFFDHIPKLFGNNLALVSQLRSFTVLGENWEDFILVAAGMSSAWRACRNTTQMFFLRYGAKAEISLEMDLRGHYQGNIFHWEIDFIEVLPPLLSEMCIRELAGLLLIVRRNVGSNGPASPSQLTIVAVSPNHSPVAIPSSSHAGVQEGRSYALTWKRRSLLLVPSSDEVIEFDDVGLHPRKARKTVSVARFLSGIGDILNG